MMVIRIKCWEKTIIMNLGVHRFVMNVLKHPTTRVKTKLKQAILEISPHLHMIFHPTYSLTIALHPLLSKYCVHYVSDSVFSEYHKVFFAICNITFIHFIYVQEIISNFRLLPQGRT